MENKEFVPVYPYSFAEAKRLGEMERWKTSNRENIACREGIEETIRKNFDSLRLKKDCAADVITQFGYHRTAYVLANSLQQKAEDGRFSRDNQQWAKQIFIPPDKDSGFNRNLTFAVDSHPAVLDGFVNQYRREYQNLGLFDHTHCLPDKGEQDFTGKVIVLSPRIISEEYLSPRSQLWYCSGGFGSSPDSLGRAVFVTCLGDGEKTRLNREDFIGVMEDCHMPDWARESLLKFQGQTQEGAAGRGGMSM